MLLHLCVVGNCVLIVFCSSRSVSDIVATCSDHYALLLYSECYSSYAFSVTSFQTHFAAMCVFGCESL